MQIGQGASQYGQGAAPSEICLAGTLIYITISTWGYQILPEIMFTKKLQQIVSTDISQNRYLKKPDIPTKQGSQVHDVTLICSLYPLSTHSPEGVRDNI